MQQGTKHHKHSNGSLLLVLLAATAIFMSGSNAFGRSQNPENALEPVFERFDSRDGLPNNTVHALHVAKDGMLWIGTTDGLARWDGYRFEVFRSGLESTHIKAIEEAPDGHLYVLTHSALLKMNTHTGGFVQWPFEDAQSMLVLKQHILVQASGSVYRVRLSGSMSPGDPPELILGTGNDRNRPERIWSLLQGKATDPDVESPVWMTSPGSGIIRLNPETLETEAWPWPEGNDIPLNFPGLFRWKDNMVVSHLQGAFIVSESGAFSVANGDWFVQPWHAIAGNEGSPESTLIGTDLGVVLADGRRILVENGPTRELSNVVLAAASMPDGAVWLGTRNGLYKMEWPRPQGSDLLMRGTPVLSLARADRSIWVGTFGQGIYTLASGSAQATGIHAGEALDMRGCDPTVWTLYIDAAQRVWAGTNTGLCLWDRRDGHFVNVALDDDETVSVNAITEYPEGRLQIGTTNGRCTLDLDQPGRERSAREEGDSREAPDSDTVSCAGPKYHVQGLAVDGAGNFWMTLFDGRVFKNGEVLEEVTLGGEGGWMISDVGAAVAISSATGLTMITGDGRAHTYLQDHIVYGAGLGPDGAVWASTNKGLYRGLVRDSEGANSEESSGLLDGDFEPVGVFQSEFNRRALLSTDSALHVGGMEGLTRINRMAETAPLALAVTRVDVVGRDTSWVWPGLSGDGLHLSHNHVSFDIEMAALGARRAADAVVYRYRLEGFDTDWNVPSARTARYTNLPPGSYRLRAEARGPAALAQMTIPVHVSRAWYATWWFRLLVGLLLVAAGVTAWQLRMAHVNAMARVRSRIASDLHDDVGSQLAGIALLSELVAGNASLPSTESNRLTIIGNTARELVSSVRDISWLAHPAHDQIQDLSDRMHEAAHALLGNRIWHMDAHETQGKRRLSPHARRHVFLIYKEALNNIGRHAGTQAEVTITLRTRGALLLLSVSDTGSGFQTKVTGTGQGLRNMSDRAQEAGGQLEIRSAPGEGTTISLEVPL